MEFCKKLQELRKSRGLTQEELAKSLYVSRTAVSKWESGRGYPGIESLKAIAEYFSVTVDELLSSEQLLLFAEQDQKQRTRHLQSLVCGLLDLSHLLLLFLPIFAGRIEGKILEGALFSVSGIRIGFRVSFAAVLILLFAFGVLTLAMQPCRAKFWVKNQSSLSYLLSALAVLLFTLCLQPYAASFSFILLVIKAVILTKYQ